ncbi:glycosyltransferase family 2 protein [Maribacter arenosus]|uniref:Glycosyltransferase family 2 protein n=1 Tax=Maribacter arenosus TaxID=1854708 RepID=A0ABR7VAZ6_9FLAO|nr:glycosyltransferase family 2 protein [Maribacter arenosus]MBD0850792.1 glycosyltransferase family 2 protein [Maribacter arenosus]
MQNISPYITHYVQLEEKDTLFVPIPELGKRYYYVFWWHGIPLGHLYLEEVGSADLTMDILNAIIPTLTHYNGNKQQINNIAQAYRNKDFLKFSKVMEEILSSYRSLNIPDEVDVSVVICTRNRSKSLKKCLDSLSKQICTPMEIIVVDNAPTDDSTKFTVALYPGVSYYKEPRPGLDIARNSGARVAKYPIVAYTDDDVRVDPLWSFRIWESFLQENIDAMTGLVIASSLETESQQIFEKHWGFNKGYRDIYFYSDFIFKSSTAPKVWDIGAGANMAFRKKAIERVNYFDDRLDVGAAGCSGDSEIWFRILSSNMTIHYNPRAFVFHEHREDIHQLHKQLFGYMRGHSASVLIQHAQNKAIGYKKYLYFKLPKYYFSLLLTGFPNYNFRYQTLWSEIKGLISGIRFYHNNKHKPPLTP